MCSPHELCFLSPICYAVSRGLLWAEHLVLLGLQKAGVLTLGEMWLFRFGLWHLGSEKRLSQLLESCIESVLSLMDLYKTASYALMGTTDYSKHHMQVQPRMTQRRDFGRHFDTSHVSDGVIYIGPPN